MRPYFLEIKSKNGDKMVNVSNGNMISIQTRTIKDCQGSGNKSNRACESPGNKSNQFSAGRIGSAGAPEVRAGSGIKASDFTSGLIEYPVVFSEKQARLGDFLERAKSDLACGNLNNAKKCLQDALGQSGSLIVQNSDKRRVSMLVDAINNMHKGASESEKAELAEISNLLGMLAKSIKPELAGTPL
jgi:hypothetical protein